MARVKIDPRSTRARLSEICEHLHAPSRPDMPNNYAYEAGYLSSALERALDLLPVGKRQDLLAAFEKDVRPKTRKVVNLMSGTELEIAYDTPLACDPSSETYWSI